MFVLPSQVDISDSYHGLVDERGSSVNIAKEEEASCVSIAIQDIPASLFGFVQLPSLSSTLIWAKMLLIERDMWGTVDGTHMVAVETTEVVETTAWEKKQARTLATICTLVDDSRITPKASWSTPQDHQSESFANELYLRQRFYWVILPEGADVSVHSLKDIIVLLADVGA